MPVKFIYSTMIYVFLDTVHLCRVNNIEFGMNRACYYL